MYTTVKGSQWGLNREHWKQIKRAASSRFGGSRDFFDACWRQYRGYILHGTDDPKNISDVMNWLEAIASEKVNNPNSRFYIYG